MSDDISHMKAIIQFFSLEDLKKAIEDAKEGSPLHTELKALLWEVKRYERYNRETDELL